MSYTVKGYLDNGISQVAFYYVLTTRAGWKDTIGTSDITVRFPYPINDMNFLGGTEGWLSAGGREVKWHFEDFEPDKDISVWLMKPSLWQSILIETDNTNHNPQDGEA